MSNSILIMAIMGMLHERGISKTFGEVRDAIDDGSIARVFESITGSTIEPITTKGHKEPSHDVLVMRLRERIDAQTKVMTEQFARIKELENKVEDAKLAGANEMLDLVVSSLREYPNGGGDVNVMREVENLMQDAENGKWYGRAPK